MSEISRKLTVSEIMGEFEPPKLGEARLLLRIGGTVSGSDKGKTDLGEYTRLYGDFAAVNLTTGEESVSGECILPAGLGEMLAARAAQGPTQFAVDIGVLGVTRKESPTGYVYQVFNPNPEPNPVVKTLRNLPLPKGIKALPEPKAS